MLSVNLGQPTIDLCNDYCDGIKNSSGKVTLEGMVEWIFNRKEKYLESSIIALRKNTSIRTQLNDLKVKLSKSEIKDILSCNVSDLKTKSDEYNIYQIDYWVKSKEKKKLLYTIFNYDLFRDYRKSVINGFWLSEKLGIKCCPYCNRNYTSSHQTYYKDIRGEVTEKYVFPEFDHFYPKENYPLLAVSFYNLIPSCNICNTHFKQNREPDKIFNPYKIVGTNHFAFKNFPVDVSTLYGAKSNIVLDFDYNSDAITNEEIKNSIEFFGIKDTYEKCHSKLVEDIIYKRLAFSDRYIKELQATYKISFEDAYRIVFETYFQDEKLYKRPFSKLKKDIYESLK